ncbi:MAG: (2Fe-2S)-binding protein [Bacteroidales bacterium]|nr:(2Fe-2S)-binding protein [Bacteroidales bacterium]MCF8455123.1 (2Fe-2S)-binding protein [Bacteroidales bacterium]
MANKLICLCNEVSEKEIVGKIESGEAKSLPEISKQTQAGTGCGRCRRSIREILKKYLEASQIQY